VRIGVVVGNPKPRSRTRRIAEELALELSQQRAELFVVDLCDYAGRLFDWPDAGLSELADRLTRQEVVIFATPTFKAAYSGLLKAFLDRYPHRGLQGVFAIPVMTISDPAHALAPEVSLRPLLVELGAIMPTSGLAFPTPAFDRRKQVISEWLEMNRAGIDVIAAPSLTSQGDR